MRKAGKLWSDTRAQSLLTQTLLIVPLLLLVLGLVYDLGAVAVAQVQAQDVIDLAAQDAAKYIHPAVFETQQTIVLTEEAAAAAVQRVRTYGGGHVQLTALTLFNPDERHTALYVAGEVTVPTAFLRLIGIPEVTRQAYAIALPAFGIVEEGE